MYQLVLIILLLKPIHISLYLVSTSPDTAKYPNMIAGPCKTNITTSYDATPLYKGYTKPKKDFQTKLTAVRV